MLFLNTHSFFGLSFGMLFPPRKGWVFGGMEAIFLALSVMAAWRVGTTCFSLVALVVGCGKGWLLPVLFVILSRLGRTLQSGVHLLLKRKVFGIPFVDFVWVLLYIIYGSNVMIYYMGMFPVLRNKL
jgi:hypothetical protein